MDSLLWRGRRSTVFGFGNPTGGERAKELFDSMTTEAEYRIRYISDSLRTIFVTGRVQDVDYSNLLKMQFLF